MIHQLYNQLFKFSKLDRRLFADELDELDTRMMPVSWSPIELNWFQQEYYFPPNTEPNLKYYFGKYIENSID